MRRVVKVLRARDREMDGLVPSRETQRRKLISHNAENIDYGRKMNFIFKCNEEFVRMLQFRL